MRKPRLTPAQIDKLVSVAIAWGHVFIVYSDYAFLEAQGLVRTASPLEIEAHYARLQSDLDETAKRVRAAAEAGDWRLCRELAGSAQAIAADLSDRAEEYARLVVLTDSAREYALARHGARQAVNASQ